jgi:hypothetical protein
MEYVEGKKLEDEEELFDYDDEAMEGEGIKEVLLETKKGDEVNVI